MKLTLEEINNKLAEGHVIIPPINSKFKVHEFNCTLLAYTSRFGKIIVGIEGQNVPKTLVIDSIKQMTELPNRNIQWRIVFHQGIRYLLEVI